MIREIEIDGKRVPFKATASTTARYRDWFGSDLLKDMMQLYNAQTQRKQAQDLSSEQLEMFFHLAYTMAKQANSNLPADCNDWLDEFSVFPINDIFPQIVELWQESLQTLDTSKKK